MKGGKLLFLIPFKADCLTRLPNRHPNMTTATVFHSTLYSFSLELTALLEGGCFTSVLLNSKSTVTVALLL